MQTGWTRRQKPPIGTPLDRTNSLARGLLYFAPCWELSGTSVADVANVAGGLSLTASGYGSTSPWLPGRGGTSYGGFNCNLAGANAFATVPNTLRVGWPQTIIGGFSTLATPTNFSTLFGIFPNNNNASPFSNLSFFAETGPASWFMEYNNAGTGQPVTTTIPYTPGNFVLGASVTTAGYTIYSNGLKVASSSVGIGQPTYASTATMGIGDITSNNRSSHSVIYWWAWWGRTLSAAEHTAMAMNPWQIFKPWLSVAEVAPFNLGYTFSGSSSSSVGSASSNFSVAPSGIITDTVRVVSSVAGDTLSASNLIFSASNAAQAFTVTATSPGHRTITATSAGAYTMLGSPITLTANVPFSLSGPSVLSKGVPATLTVTPAVATTDTVTFSDGGAGGTFTPSSLSWAASGSTQTVTYTPAGSGGITIAATSSAGASISNRLLSLTSYMVAVDAYVTKYGKLIVFGTNSSYLVGNGNPIPAIVTGVNANPTVSVNGNAIQIGPPTWLSSSLDSPFVTYLLQCGSVQSLAFTNAGTASYTSPTVRWNGDGGGSGLTLGTPVMASGILAYSITSAGSGYFTNFATPVPGGTFNQQAFAWVNVSTTTSTLTQAAISGTTVTYTGAISGGAANALVGAIFKIAGFANPGNNGTFTVTSSTTTTLVVTNAGGVNETHAATAVTGTVTSVVPITGSSLAYGTGYSGTLTSVSLPGSGAFAFIGNASEGLWGNAPSAAPGTGLTVSCTIGNYIQSVPVSNGGTGFTSPPTFRISDAGSGTGAAVVPVMSGPLATDVLTYSATSGWLTTKVQSTSGLTVPPATNAPVTNWVGQLEGPTGRMIGFTAPPTTLLAGGNVAGETPYEYSICFMAKNKLKAAQPWKTRANTSSLTVDSNYYPTFWSPGGQITSQFYGLAGARGFIAMTAQYEGNWTIQYDDDYFLGTASLPSWVSVLVSSGVNISIVPGPHVTLPVAGAVTISGGAVTAIAITSGGSGIQAAVVTIAGTTGAFAAYVATCSGGAVTGLHKIAGGSGYTTTPTVTITPVTLSGSAVTVTYAIAFATENIGTTMVLNLDMVAGADGICHVHNPWAFAPNNTISRAKPYALDDNVLADLTNNGNGPASLRYMSTMGGATDPQIIDPSDIINPFTWSWEAPGNFNNQVPPGPPSSPTFSGTTTALSNVITGIADTSSLVVGQPLVGNGIPGIAQSLQAPMTTITAINSPTSITISVGAQLTGVQSLSVNPSTSGVITFNSLRFYNTNPANATYAWSSPKIYSSENWAISGTDSFGSYLDITNGPNGANDNGLLIATWVGNNQAYGVLELVSNVPHRLKTGQWLGAGIQTTQLFVGNTTNNSTSVTGIAADGSNPVPQLFAGQLVTGTGITAGTYIVAVNSPTSITLSHAATASGTAVVLTAITAVPWSVSGLQQFSGATIGGTAWVTGPNSVAIFVGVAGGFGTGLQTVNSTTAIPIYVTVNFFGCAMSEPVEYVASAVSNWPNTALHLNIPWVCSDKTVAAYAQKVAANIGKTNPIYIEMGNEHWNDGQDLEPIWEFAQTALPRYLPVGTSLYPHFTPTRAVASYTTTGAALPGNDYTYALRAANKHYVFCQAFAAAGGNSSLVKLVYGSFINGQTVTANIVGAVNAYNLPQDYVAVAPYFNAPTDTPPLVAGYPAGYAGNSSNGNWPVDAINDFLRTYTFYSQTYAGIWSGHAAKMVGTTLKTYGYEGSITQSTQGLPFCDYVNQDAFHHPSFYEVIWGYLLMLQNGNYNVANSGMSVMNYFTLYFNSVDNMNWKLADSVAQPIGYGLANQYQTPQGGLPGTGNPNGYYQTNESVSLQAVHDWIGYAPGSGTTKSKLRWFTGLSKPII